MVKKDQSFSFLILLSQLFCLWGLQLTPGRSFLLLVLPFVAGCKGRSSHTHIHSETCSTRDFISVFFYFLERRNKHGCLGQKKKQNKWEEHGRLG